MATLLNYKTITLEFRTQGENLETKFSDLQDTLKTIRWSKINSITITMVPCYRDANFEEAVIRYVFGKQEIYEIRKTNKEYERLIYG